MKRTLSFLLVFILIFSFSVTSFAAQGEEMLLGDADGDGEITIIDATTIQRHLVNLLQLSEDRLKAADVSGDGIDITDATSIQRWLVSLPVAYPIGEPDKADVDKSDTLVVVFSRTGNTKPLAVYAAEIMDADIFEIEAAVPYTDDDIKYYTNCRADREQSDPTARPEIANMVENMEQYSTVVIAYPIWHGQAPKIIYTFLESYDFSGKTIIPFCTSASSGIGTSATNLHALAPDSIWKDGRRFPAGTSKETLTEWLSTFE